MAGQFVNSDILTEIEQRLPGLSRSEQKVAQWLLANSRQAVDLPISVVAARCGVSDPTVIRFCRALDLTGYRELKTHLIAALQKPQSYLQYNVSSEDAPVDAAVKALENSIHALVELRATISTMPFEAALNALAQARQIVFAGLGASGCVASDACHKFFRLGIPCTTALDAQTILQHASIAQAADVFICVSHTGQWPEVIQGCHLAMTRGATVISVTRQHSPLAENSTMSFYCNASEDTNVYTPMSSRLAQLTVLDALQVDLAVRLGPEGEENLKQTKDAIANKRLQQARV